MKLQPKEVELLLEDGDRIAIQKALKDFSPSVPLRLHFLRTATIEGSAPFLQLAFARRGRSLEAEWGELGNLTPPEKSETSPIDALVIYWRPQDLFPSHFIRHGQKPELKQSQDLQPILDHFNHLLNQWTEWKDAPIYIVDTALPHLKQAGSWSSALNSPSVLIQRLNLQLNEVIASHSNLHLIPQQAWEMTVGAKQLEDLRLDLYGKIPFSPNQFGSWSRMVSDAMISLTTARRKVLAVDADNTLWGGVLGEDGWAGLTCGQAYPGNVFLRIQERLLSLKDSGLLLVLLSKNDEPSVREAFENMPELRLSLNDFIEVHCNYDEKHLNLKLVAKSLNLGTESFAFFDDSDFERQQMSSFLPEVLVINENPEAISMLESLEHPELRPHDSLPSDTHLQYQQRQERLVAEESAPTKEAFLESLEIHYRVQPLNEGLVPRAHQLCQKTNQFNLTTRRHGEAQLRSWMKDPNAIVLLLEAGDRFGDQGWVALAIATKEKSQWTLDSFLMSCRVLGRGLEDALMAHLSNTLTTKGASSLNGTFIPTKKNSPCAKFLPDFGFEPTESNEERDNFRLHLSSSPLTCPSHLKLIKPT